MERDGFSTPLPKIDRVVTAITSTKRQMFIMVVSCPLYLDKSGEPGNHALAAYLSRGGRMHFFDPNEGEYIMKKNQFGPWFPQFLMEKYGQNQSLVEYWAVKQGN